jgi:hypothetical protein
MVTETSDKHGLGQRSATGHQPLATPATQKWSRNSFPDLLDLDIDLVSLESGEGAIRLNAHFGRHSLTLSKMRIAGIRVKPYIVTFGLIGGQLHFRLTGISAPLEKRIIGVTQINESVPMTKTTARDTTRKELYADEARLEGQISLKPSLTAKEGSRSERAEENKNGVTSQFEWIHAVVKTFGGARSPVWAFESPDSDTPLHGWAPGNISDFDERPLAKVVFDGMSSLVAGFWICARNIKILHVDSHKFSNPPPVALAVAKHALAKNLEKTLKGSQGWKCLSVVQITGATIA